ncbi:MAG: hypothetical protein QOH31_5626, partial [Verrucomicrobiota bacterium]
MFRRSPETSAYPPRQRLQPGYPLHAAITGRERQRFDRATLPADVNWVFDSLWRLTLEHGQLGA